MADKILHFIHGRFFPPIKKQYNLEIVPRLCVIYLGLQNTKAE